ncbi:MAG: allantoinase AllB [Alkalispirochaetaceae bacterium]
MKLDRLIRGAEVARSSGRRRLDIGISDGLIVALEDEITGAELGKGGEIDGSGLVAYPGVIDSHLHFNDPGRDHWEGVATGSAALAAGGGVCFVDMPLNSSPPTLDGPSFDAKLEVCKARSRTDFGLYGGLTPINLPRMEELAERGVLGFKAFMCPSGIDDFPYADDLTLYRGMEIASRLDLPVLLHAESASITGALSEAMRARGRRDVRSFLESRPILAELEAIGRALLYAEETGCRVHIVHVSNPKGVELVRRAAGAGRVDATCETCPHYLMLTDEDMERIGPRAKCAPPLRDAQTRDALIGELSAGRIDTVGSDHSPAPRELKETGDFATAWGGIAGVQTTLRSLLTLGIADERIVALLAENPASRFRMARKGGIEIGNEANIALLDLSVSRELERGELRDRHQLSPYVGMTFTGEVRSVYLRGEEIGEETRGRLVTPEV